MSTVNYSPSLGGSSDYALLLVSAALLQGKTKREVLSKHLDETGTLKMAARHLENANLDDFDRELLAPHRDIVGRLITSQYPEDKYELLQFLATNLKFVENHVRELFKHRDSTAKDAGARTQAVLVSMAEDQLRPKGLTANKELTANGLFRDEGGRTSFLRALKALFHGKPMDYFAWMECNHFYGIPEEVA